MQHSSVGSGHAAVTRLRWDASSDRRWRFLAILRRKITQINAAPIGAGATSILRFPSPRVFFLPVIPHGEEPCDVGLGA